MNSEVSGRPGDSQEAKATLGSRWKGSGEFLRWFAAEPYRVFFPLGVLWSLAGVSLWLLYYAQWLPFYPGIVHARIMIEAFGGSFLVGFLGTAGPRMVSSPLLSVSEFLWLLVGSIATGSFHLLQDTRWGDISFGVMLGSLGVGLLVRGIWMRQEAPPPGLILATAGVLSGCFGVGMLASPGLDEEPQAQILGRLLLYQGTLLAPVLGVGVFLFPRILGGTFGMAERSRGLRWQWCHAVAAVIGLGFSFLLETEGDVRLGRALRLAVCVLYLGISVNWRRHPAAPAWGTLTSGLMIALGLGASGLLLAATGHPQHVSIELLLYVGGFGLLMLVVGSRVIFGHSGQLAGFHARNAWVRVLIGLTVLAATTRATVAWVPSTLVSHHIYAAGLWVVVGTSWMAWHRRRFFRPDLD